MIIWQAGVHGLNATLYHLVFIFTYVIISASSRQKQKTDASESSVWDRISRVACIPFCVLLLKPFTDCHIKTEYLKSVPFGRNCTSHLLLADKSFPRF